MLELSKSFYLVLFTFFLIPPLVGQVIQEEVLEQRHQFADANRVTNTTSSRVASVQDSEEEIENLIRDFFISGSCLEIRNINSKSAVGNGTKLQIGKFQQDGNLDIGFEEGIILSSGRVVSAQGPNSGVADTQFNESGDPEINNSNDAAYLEFEFKPTGDEISFNYVFASEEYPNFVCQFNDAFSFFIQKVGSGDPLENIALIPGTTLPVTIDNVNDQFVPNQSCPAQDFSEFYIPNPMGSPNTQYNGYTTVLSASKTGLDECEWYYMKMLIADVGDSAFDSAVFLEANSFADNSPIELNAEGTIAGTQDAEESCTNGFFIIERTDETPEDEDFVIELNIGGTATPGIDYEALPSTVTIPAFEQSITIPVIPFFDEETEGTETVFIEATNVTCGCANTSISAELNIIDFTLATDTVDDTFCENGSYELPNGDVVTETGSFDIIIPRVSNPDCDSILVFNLTEVPPPVSQNANLQECSDGDSAQFVLSNADANVSTENGTTITYHATIDDAENNENSLPNNFTSTNTVVFARVVDITTNCYSVSELELEVIANPLDISLTDEKVCDSDNDGQSSFNLSQKVSEILGSQSISDFNVTFHLTEADAQDDVNKITDPPNFTVTSNPQIIFVRVENEKNESCDRVLSFEISFEDNPQANDVPISVPTCSVSATAIFNLNELALEVAANDAFMQVEFFEDELGTLPISDPSAYESSTATVYGKVTDPTTGCYSFGEIMLEVLGTPIQRDQQVTDCATNNANNQSTFNLEALTPIIIGNTQNVSVSYHTSFAEADADVPGGINPITNPSSYNSESDIIFARSEATFESTFCHTVSEISITVNNRPIVSNDTFQVCVPAGDEAEFNLLSRVQHITTSTTADIRFFRDADLTDEIINPGQFTSTTTTVFARVENPSTLCRDQAEINLQVIEIPTLDEEISITECKANEIAVFDLIQLKTDLEIQYPDLVFSFFADENLTTLLPDRHTLTESATVFVRFDLIGTPCFNIEPVELVITPTPFQDLGEELVCISDGFTLPDGSVVFEPGDYEVIIQDSFGCDVLTTTTLIVADIEFASAFSPNGNGVNDTFGGLPNDACVGEVQDFHLQIFNKWGEKVFETTNFLQHWDGKFNGQLLAGSYLWQATYTFQEEQFDRRGTIAVLF